MAGVSPQVGLYAAPGALLFYAMFASSRHLVVGPMSATAALSAAVVGSHASFTELTAALAITGQVPKLFGVSKGSGDFFEQLGHLLSQLGQTQGWTLAVGAGSLAVVLGFRFLAPRIPGELVAVVASIVVAKATDRGAHGVALVGHIPAGLPLFGVPQASLKDYISHGRVRPRDRARRVRRGPGSGEDLRRGAGLPAGHVILPPARPDPGRPRRYPDQRLQRTVGRRLRPAAGARRPAR